MGLYGDRPWIKRAEPLDELILTLLSQHTNDRNRDIAFGRLKEAFANWEESLGASIEEIAHLIRPAGLGNQKAVRLKGILQTIREANGGRLSLDFLNEMDKEQALNWLKGLPGVGPKTAACVLMFSFGRPAFPVDTHIHRLVSRLGWIEERTTDEKAHQILDRLVPDPIKYRLHLNLIAHGRTICRPTKPRCPICPLTDLCSYYRRITCHETQ